MLPPLLQRLAHPAIVVADGAMGTMLMERGLRAGECPERVNLDAPEMLEEIALQYLRAGAEIIQANTFGASPLKLSGYHLEGRTVEINARGVEAVRRVVGREAYVSASCGPCGKILEPYGDASSELVYESFCRQMRAVIDAGADLICIETMTDLREAVLAVRAAKSAGGSLPVVASMTFDATPKGFRTVMGTGIQEAVQGLTEAGADIVGSNCGNGIQRMVAIAEEFLRHTDLPVIIQSNAGLPLIRDDTVTYPESPDFMAEESRKLVAAGVRIVGGCCGTTPAHTAALAAILRH